MTAIWQNDGTEWRLLAPTGFPDEQTLHDLVEETPQILPLAGAPRLVVVGKEVGLGNGKADLVAVEPSGRLAIVEIKLSRNAEARRAVVAQVLTYAAHLKGLDPATVERDVLGATCASATTRAFETPWLLTIRRDPSTLRLSPRGSPSV